MMETVADRVFPFLRELAEEGSAYGQHMKDARIGFTNAALLDKVVGKIDKIPMADRDTKGDLYEYMLGKIASAGQNGQFRTPRHIINLMVYMRKSTPHDTICDPAAGTCGFLVGQGSICGPITLKYSGIKSLPTTFKTPCLTGWNSTRPCCASGR